MKIVDIRHGAMWDACWLACVFARMSHFIRVAFSLEAHLSPLPGAMAARDATAPPPQSPVAKARDLSPPPAPGRSKKGRNSHGQVLADTVAVVLMSGDLLAEIVRSDEAKLRDDFWYTATLRLQIATLLNVEPCRLTIADSKGATIADDQCVLDGEPLTAIVGPEEPFVFRGALRA